ncbi:MAG: hypothetical protein ABFD60_07940 [Bryobacteraceae bacterium]
MSEQNINLDLGIIPASFAVPGSVSLPEDAMTDIGKKIVARHIGYDYKNDPEFIIDEAALIADINAAISSENEACAKVADEVFNSRLSPDNFARGRWEAADKIRMSIRARIDACGGRGVR